MKKIIFPLVVLVIIVVAGIAIYASTKGQGSSADENKNTDTESQGQTSDNFKSGDSVTVENPVAILFYGNGCPHCADVEEWIKENNVSEKVKFDQLEVWYNKDNAAKLIEKAEACGLSANSVGVPFLYDIENNKCLSGSDKVEEYFKSKI